MLVLFSHYTAHFSEEKEVEKDMWIYLFQLLKTAFLFFPATTELKAQDCGISWAVKDKMLPSKTSQMKTSH